MTSVADVQGDTRYIKCLDHGFVGLVDYMGSDADICQAARTSYGKGTKSVSEDRGLIRYLMRKRHTSPIEMCEIKLHIKLPIFVMRQLVRHRTSSLNEYSGRYSEMTDEFYLPEIENLKPQSKNNKQGRGGEFNKEQSQAFLSLINASYLSSYADYKDLLRDDYNPGLTRELARIVLPLGNYTEVYWKQNLHNLFHMLNLRLDLHAQYEIRVFAQAIYDIVQPLFPVSCEAFEDYVRQAYNLSRMEKALVKSMLANVAPNYIDDLIEKLGSKKAVAISLDMSVSELNEFMEEFVNDGRK